MIPYMGIEMGENTTDTEGIFVLTAIEGFPADNAGIRSGDIITKFDGEPLRTNFELLAQMLRR